MARLALFLTLVLMVAFSAIDRVRAQDDTRRIVIDRQLLMRDALSSYWPLLNVSNGKSTDLAEAAAAIVTLREAFTKSVSLFPAGTAKEETIGTRARPEIWTDGEAFQGAASHLLLVLDDLEKAALAGDVDAFKQAFEPFAEACTACHEFRPSAGGKFRYPK